VAEIFLCIKTFTKEPNFQEIMAAFSSKDAAQRFNKEFPLYSMDDPESFDMTKKVMDVNRNRWNIY